MSFRASNVIPAQEYMRAKQLAVQVMRLAENRSIEFSTGASSDQVLAVADNLGSMRDALNTIKAVPGIDVYATAQEDDVAYDVSIEFNALIAAIDATISEIVTTLPKDGNDWLLIRKINPDGSLSPRSFTGAQLSGLRSSLDVIAAAVT